MRRLVYLALLVGLLSTSFGAATLAESVTVSHMVWQFMFGQDIDFLEELADEFMSLHPDIKVELEIQRSVRDAVITRTAAGIPPDVLAVSSFDALPLFKEGVLLDLAPMMAKDPAFSGDPFLPGMLDAYTLKNEKVSHYGLPYQVLAWTATYNKDHLSEAGLQFPQVGPNWTWETAREMGKKLTKWNLDGSTARYGMMVDGSKKVDWAYWMPLTHQAGGGIFERAIDPQTMNFENQAVRDAANYLFSLYDSGIAPLWVREPSTINITSGKVSIAMHDVPSSVESYKQALGENVSIGHIRQPQGPVRDGWFSDGQGFAIHANSKNKEAAWEWVKFLTLRAESGQKLILDRSRMSALKANVPFYERNAKLFDSRGVVDALSNPNNTPRYVLSNTTFWGKLNSQMQKAATKEISLDAALEEANRLGRELLGIK